MQLITDGAYWTLITICYIYGFVLVGNLKIVGHLVHDRYWYALMALGASILYFFPDSTEPTRFVQAIFYADKYLMGWTISLTVLGFAKRYLNSDHTLRKRPNTSIYPFYLMQQPVIVVVPYYVVQLALGLVFQGCFNYRSQLDCHGGMLSIYHSSIYCLAAHFWIERQSRFSRACCPCGASIFATPVERGFLEKFSAAGFPQAGHSSGLGKTIFAQSLQGRIFHV